jgi:hypothetical protein
MLLHMDITKVVAGSAPRDTEQLWILRRQDDDRYVATVEASLLTAWHDGNLDRLDYWAYHQLPRYRQDKPEKQKRQESAGNAKHRHSLPTRNRFAGSL